jgi:hypothetical protein
MTSAEPDRVADAPSEGSSEFCCWRRNLRQRHSYSILH